MGRGRGSSAGISNTSRIGGQMEIVIIRGERDERFSDLRSDYLDSLCEPIELYSEVMSRDASVHMMVIDGDRAGYALVGEKGILLELHVVKEYIPLVDQLFDALLESVEITKIVCQSWDHLLMGVCLRKFEEHKVIGFNFRERIEPPELIPDLGFNERPATLDDVDLLTRYSDGLFDKDEIKDIPYWIEVSECIIFEDGPGNFVGYGMINRTIEGRNWFDIGMYVKPEFRKRGYGTYIINRLVDICGKNGWRPTAGCDRNNVGSKKTLEKVGFVSKHVMVEFSV